MTTFLKRTALMVALSGLIATGFAQTTMSDTTKRYDRKSFRTWSIGVHAGVLSSFTPFNNSKNGDFRTTQSDWGYGGYIKKQILPGFGVQADFLAGEVAGLRSNALPGNTPAQNASGFRSHIDWSASVSANLTIANLSFNHERSFITPYFTGGAGYMSSKATVYNTPAGASTNFNENWFIPVGAGLKLGLTKGLNLDLGYNVYFMKDNNFDGVASDRDDKFSYAHAGFEFALGKNKSSQLQNFSPVAALRKANAQEAAELRSKLTAVETQRMADAAQYAKDMADDDRDGVANNFDRCPGTPADTAVDGKGCPIKMPAPIIMAPVTQVTQVTERIVVTAEDRRVLDEAIKDLEFATGKSTLKETSFPTLNKVAEILKQKNFSLKLAGHTDNVGSASANLKLSKDRAQAVKAYLVAQGANASRIEANGYGAAQPIESNKTDEGRQKNRRVEFSLL